MQLHNDILIEFKKHVLSAYPAEACGVMVAGKYIPCKNIHETPQKAFIIDPKDIIMAQKEGKIEAIFHSHPYDVNDISVHENGNDPKWPSVKDQEQWMKGNEPWVIVSTDGGGISQPVIMDEANPTPLLGREFVWGVTDCFNLVRDYFKEQCGITLRNRPRRWWWWNEGDNLFEADFEEWGFTRISPEEADINDVCFFKSDSAVINHLGIISGQNEMMQQGLGSLSRISRFDKYKRHVAFYARYTGIK